MEAAGLTGVNWNVSGNVINSGPGTTKTLRISAFSNDFTPLNGMGTLFNLRMLRVSNTPGATSTLAWKPAPDNFIFIDDSLAVHTSQSNRWPHHHNRGIIADANPERIANANCDSYVYPNSDSYGYGYGDSHSNGNGNGNGNGYA